MKNKFIQVVLGALGSILTIAIQYYATGSSDPAVTVAGGASVNALLGSVVSDLKI